jgi:hypothetical protein
VHQDAERVIAAAELHHRHLFARQQARRQAERCAETLRELPAHETLRPHVLQEPGQAVVQDRGLSREGAGELAGRQRVELAEAVDLAFRIDTVERQDVTQGRQQAAPRIAGGARLAEAQDGLAGGPHQAGHGGLADPQARLQLRAGSGAGRKGQEKVGDEGRHALNDA